MEAVYAASQLPACPFLNVRAPGLVPPAPAVSPWRYACQLHRDIVPATRPNFARRGPRPGESAAARFSRDTCYSVVTRTRLLDPLLEETACHRRRTASRSG